MNTFNALGFLALGSVMNALPALAPQAIAGQPVIWDLSPSALWLHFMGLLIGLIGSTVLSREVVLELRSLRRAIARPAAVPQPVATPALSTETAAA